MDKTNSKILTLCFATAGAIGGVTFHLLVKSFAAAFGIIARVSDSDLVRHFLPVIIGFAIFLMLQFNEKVLVWGDEVVVEIKKVVWPSQKDVTTTTTAVIIMVVISSLVISSFDVISAYVLKFVLGQ